jgi:tRNA dimethylallyltransferase
MINKPPLIVIVGPTAVGKTKTSIELALRFNAEIVSADSRLLYRGMDIGTAKPTLEEQALVPHHLLDVADPDEIWSLARYQRGVYAALEDIHGQKKIPFLVGGTGQYVKAVVEGWKIPEVKANPKLRKALNSWADEIGYQGLHDRLKHLDLEAAQLISPQNLRRSIRALEVIFQTGKRFSEQRRKQEPHYRTLILGIYRPRQDLYERIDSRIETMLGAGFVNEVQGLMDNGYSQSLPSLSAIGYSQIAEYLTGSMSLDEAVAQIKVKTRQFVRRQANWFKLENPNITWFQAGFDLADDMAHKIEQFILNSTPKTKKKD